MTNLDNLSRELLLLILESEAKSGDGDWIEPILRRRDFVRLSCVNRELYNSMKKLIWCEPMIKIGFDQKTEPIVQLYNALIENPGNASLIEKATFEWVPGFEHMCDLDNKEDEQIRKNSISYYDMQQSLLRQLPCLKHLSIIRHLRPGQKKLILDLEEFPVLTSLSLSGFDMKAQDIFTIIANRRLRSLSLSAGILEEEWPPAPSGLCSNVTHLRLSLQSWEKTHIRSADQTPHYMNVDQIDNLIIKDILSLFPGLTGLFLTLGSHVFGGADDMALILDELNQRCKIRSLHLQSQKDPGEGRIDLSSWNYLETLQATMHCLFPLSADFHERVDIYSRLPKSLKILKIDFPYNIERGSHDFRFAGTKIKLSGVLWKRGIMIRDDKLPPSTGDNYEWIDRLADACLDHSLPDLKEIKLIEEDLEADNENIWIVMKINDFALRRDVQEKFDRANVDIKIQVRNYQGPRWVYTGGGTQTSIEEWRNAFNSRV